MRKWKRRRAGWRSEIKGVSEAKGETVTTMNERGRGVACLTGWNRQREGRGAGTDRDGGRGAGRRIVGDRRRQKTQIKGTEVVSAE